jgi:predicted phosphodiesterase
MRIAVISDTHGNLPALRAALDAIGRAGYDALFHTGDAIGIGPAPAECLELLLAQPRTECVPGNHEAWLLEGRDALPHWIGARDARHLEWTWAQVGRDLRAAIAAWTSVRTGSFEGLIASFLHYARDPVSTDFLPSARHTPEALGRVFASTPGALVCFGHDHSPVDVRGAVHYLNPGALGLARYAHARYLTIDIAHGEYTIERGRAAYLDEDLRKLYIERDVPERAHIDRFFYRGRLGLGG